MSKRGKPGNTDKSDERDADAAPYDIAIVGGGIVGAGIARDAALRGLRVCLFEKGDYGSGTSSKSSKLIHGGLRYLEHGEIGLVFESVSERLIQSRVAPHLVRPMPFLVPIYRDSKPGLELMNIGLWIYDTLALFRAPKLHKTFRGAKAAELEPELRSDKLTGAIEYYDCVTDDSRLVLENVLDACGNGADCRSYTEVTALIRDGDGDGDGRVRGVRARDAITGQEREVAARVVVMAAGAWTDEAITGLEVDVGRQLLRRTKGVHLVFPREKLPLRRAITLLSPVDGRVLFAIPWRERLVLGTTDTDFEGSADDVYADAADAAYLCESANRYFPNADFKPSDVIATWAGLRPLISDEGSEDASSVSREHRVFSTGDGVIIIAGGKLTTYRRMAKEVVHAAIDWLEGHDEDALAGRKLSRPRTKKRPLPGAEGISDRSVEGVIRYTRELAEAHSVDYETARHLVLTYGSRAPILAERIDADDALGLRIEPALPYVWAEIAFAVEHDLARTIEDVLARRVPLLLCGTEQGLDAAERVADIMAERLSWSEHERTRQLAQYREAVADSRRFRD